MSQASRTAKELMRLIEIIREQRRVYLSQNAWRQYLSIPVELSPEREMHILRELERLERDPPMGPEIVMILNDTLLSYEKRLRVTNQELSNTRKFTQDVSCVKEEIKKHNRNEDITRYLVGACILLQIAVICLLLF